MPKTYGSFYALFVDLNICFFFVGFTCFKSNQFPASIGMLHTAHFFFIYFEYCYIQSTYSNSKTNRLLLLYFFFSSTSSFYGLIYVFLFSFTKLFTFFFTSRFAYKQNVFVVLYAFVVASCLFEYLFQCVKYRFFFRWRCC